MGEVVALLGPADPRGPAVPRHGRRPRTPVGQGHLQLRHQPARRAHRPLRGPGLRGPGAARGGRSPSWPRPSRSARRSASRPAKDPAALVEEAIEVAYHHKPSMLQDVLARRRTEIDVLNGGIAAAGTSRRRAHAAARRDGRAGPRTGAVVGRGDDMKLITFDERPRRPSGARGRAPSSNSTCRSTREYFERGGEVAETGERLALADVRCGRRSARRSSSTRPATSPTTTRSSRPSTGRTRCTRASCSSRTSTRSSARTTRSSTPRASPRSSTTSSSWRSSSASRASSSDPTRPTSYIAGYTVFNDITARDIQRQRDGVGRVLVLARASTRSARSGPWIVTRRRGPRPARAARWSCASTARCASRATPTRLLITIPHLVAYHSPQGYSRRRHHHDRHDLGRRGGAAQPVRLLPAARRRDRGRDRGRRHAAQHGRPVEAAHDTPPYAMDLYA